MPKLTDRSETTDVTNGSFFHVAKNIGGGLFSSFKIRIENLKEALGINDKQDALGYTPLSTSATTADIEPSTDRNYVDDFQLTKINNTPSINFGFSNVTFINESSKKITVSNADILLTSRLNLSIIPIGDIDEIEFYNINYSYGNFIANTSFDIAISLSEKTNKQFKINYQILN
jgi:hypothetical protein